MFSGDEQLIGNFLIGNAGSQFFQDFNFPGSKQDQRAGRSFLIFFGIMRKFFHDLCHHRSAIAQPPPGRVSADASSLLTERFFSK